MVTHVYSAANVLKERGPFSETRGSHIVKVVFHRSCLQIAWLSIAGQCSAVGRKVIRHGAIVTAYTMSQYSRVGCRYHPQ